MTGNSPAVMELAAHDEQYQELYRKHQEHERLLAAYAAKPHLSEVEDLDEKRLKKEKLALKDHMEEILRHYRDNSPS